MKLIPAIAIAVAAFGVGSTGYAKDCGSRPAKFSIPDGKTASEEQMKAANAKVVSYATAMTAYRRCLSEEIKGAGDEYEALTADLNAQVKAYNSTPAKQ